MSTTIDDDAVTASAVPYIEAVRARIGHLPRERRTELLDDLAQHLAEVAAEPDTDLSEQLGSPEDFAEEYLSSAGVELSPAGMTASLRSAARDRFTAVADHRWTVALLDFLPELRPAWWVVRGYVPVAAVLNGYGLTPVPFSNRHGHGTGWVLVGTAIALAAAVVSVRLGRAAMAGRHVGLNRWITVGGAIAALLAVPSLIDVADASVDHHDEGDAYPKPVSGAVTSAEGEPITNLFVYDAQGNPLLDVYVFDQEGRPVSTPAFDVATRIPVASDGALVVNRYPQDEQRLACGGAAASEFLPVPAPAVKIPGVNGQPGAIVGPNSAPPSTAPATTTPEAPGATTAPPTTTPTPTTVVQPLGGLPCSPLDSGG